MTRTLAGLALAISGLLAGCQDEPPTGPNAGFFSKGSSNLAISELTFDAEHIVGTERWQVSFRIPEAGSQMLTRYGLKTRLGEKLYDIKPALPVVNNGSAMVWVGPLPNLTESGKLSVEFWVVDDKGRESNRLSQDLVIQ